MFPVTGLGVAFAATTTVGTALTTVTLEVADRLLALAVNVNGPPGAASARNTPGITATRVEPAGIVVPMS